MNVSLKDEDTLCVLKVDRADKRDHGGFWTVVVYGESCAKDRKKREAAEGEVPAAAAAAEGAGAEAPPEARTVQVHTVSHQSLRPGSSITVSQRTRPKRQRSGPKLHRTP